MSELESALRATTRVQCLSPMRCEGFKITIRRSSTSPKKALSPDTNTLPSPSSDSSGSHDGILIPNMDSPSSEEGSKSDWNDEGSLSHLLASRSKAMSQEPHIALQPHVPSTYPLDHFLSVIDDLLEPSISPTCRSEGDHTPEPDRTFQTCLAAVTPEDYQYLTAKGALQLLPRALRNQLLAAYVKYVHPLLPILDLAKFLSGIIDGDDTQFDSPLLYQAVMFAGSIYIQEDINEDEAQSTKSLTGVLFERTKVLYEFETEQCAYTQIKALLLMTLWHGDMSRHKGPSYWLDLAFSTAERVGLLHDSCWTYNGPSIKPVIWCCLYVRDRIISLGSRRPVRMPVSQYPSSVLGLTSFIHEEYSVPVLEALGSAASILTRSSREQSALLFTELVKLCYCVGAILDYLYEGAWIPLPRRSSLYSLTPKCNIPPITKPSCEKLLQSWIQLLPPTASYHIPLLPPDARQESVDTVFLVHKAFLYLLYLTAMAVIYRTGPGERPSNTTLPNLKGLRASTSQIKRVLTELDDMDLLRFLPGTSVTIIMFAIEASLLDLQGSDSMVRLQAMSNLYACEGAALNLLQVYPTAELALLKTRTARSNLLGLVEI
ncbi:fungal specific transcription factor domain-containing protein [Aspergillus ibericus CBS 121593]|uniref:Xylanolytic transcriptional activator regulatory domain-containing protein n=1 Tax=Aspergillus ibericus CBS 121593 TaxID=1448316 RepID=A0A395GIZ0_9EURO|nr:hypothetical protein BO80DRAFT_368743 [Aspergillus ibericus CBS 121593]RAK95441.1 hypothetical protein BO80DRAFT_368743 [Aspergillus ibericus CBS 121593]